MSLDAPALRQLASELVTQARALFDAGPERRARGLARAFALLASRDGALGESLHAELVASAGLSPAMAEWAVETAIAPLTYEALRALEARPVAPVAGAERVRPGQLCVVVLASNIAIGAARAVGFPLLFGWPVLAKTSSDDDPLARALAAALEACDPLLAAAYRVVTFDSEREPLRAVLFEQADAVSVYGSDATLNAVRAQVGATVSFIGHGNGLGAAFVGRDALCDLTHARSVARELALDVAAYDQRGCLSPHVAWVERGGAIAPARLAELLFEELALLRIPLPRGPLPHSVAAAQLGWRGVGAIRGALYEGEGFAVSFEDDGPLRISPGYRNVQVLALDDADALPSKLAPLGVHLKCLGTAGVGDPGALVRALPTRVAPRICALGTMQRPPVDALHDGLAAWDGLLRWASRDVSLSR